VPDVAKKAVIVIDMLRDFLEEGGALYCGPKARGIIPAVAERLAGLRRQGAAVIHLTDWHAPDDREFATFGPHAVRGSRGAEIIDEIRVEPDDHVVRKTGYSGFYLTELDDLLQRLAPQEVWVMGVCTSICVAHTVSDLRDRDYEVHVPEDAVADFDEEMHRCALRHLEILGAHVEPAATGAAHGGA
jgi:nicotinamidase/pyrazinamidase